MRKRRKNKRKTLILSILLILALLALGFMIIQNPDLFQGQKQSAETAHESSNLGNVTGSNGEQNGADGTNTGTGSRQPDENGQEEQKDNIQSIIDGMTLEEKVGQLVIAGIDGYENDEHSKNLMEEDHVGGFILFKKNIQSSSQLLDLLNSLKSVNKVKNKVPLFLSVDEEGGRVSRMPEEFLKFPSNKEIGKLNNPELSYKVGSILGEELSVFGFNLDFAPVMDINSNPKNPVIGDRSFGTTAELVSRLGVETVKGIQSQNVISVVKHFPGHGDTSVDSHIGLPRVNHGLERLESFELKPFKAAIENGVDAVMIAHILLPELDADNPASFSKKIISDILRSSMGFNGVVITDDFTMGAITENYDIGKAAVKSIQAGSDIVLVCHGYDKQKAVINAILTAAQNGQLSEERIEKSVYRILALKDKYKLSDEKSGPVNQKGINDKISELFN